MKKQLDLAPAEFEIMEILWDRGEASTKNVLTALPEDRKLAYNTVATVLTRLREKGFVEAREHNFAYVYRPLVERKQIEERKLDDLVNRIFRGNLAPLAVYISRKRNLKPEQIEALEEIIKSQSQEES